MRGTLAGLGASRAEVEVIFKKAWARNEFITNIGKRSKYDYDMADGRFRWDAEKVYFDFYGQGKLRTITILWSEVRASAQLDGETFAPWAKDRWVGKLTEYAGTAHSIWNTAMWERAAWNTMNAWCTSRAAVAHGAGDNATVTKLRDVSTKAYARITLDYSVHYFVPHEKHTPPYHSDPKDTFWMATFMRHFPSQGDPRWETVLNLTPEQRSYLAVAWDTYEESGMRPTAPLMGLKATGRITDAQVAYAMQKLAVKAERCKVTPAMMREGMMIEREHRDVTRLGIEKTARIALEHMCERRDYYKRLKRYVER